MFLVRWNHKVRIFWTIWAIGWYAQRTYTGKIIEFQLFLGPLIITWWN